MPTKSIASISPVPMEEAKPKRKVTPKKPTFQVNETDKGIKVVITSKSLKARLYHAGCHYNINGSMLNEGNLASYFDLEDLYEEIKANDLFEMDHEDKELDTFIKWIEKQGVRIEAKIKEQLDKGLVSFSGLKAVFKKGDVVVFPTEYGDQAMLVDS